MPNSSLDKPRRLALDLDGTVLTCEPRQSAVLRAVLTGFGFAADVPAIWALKREGSSTSAALQKCGLAAAAAAHLSAAWREAVEEPYWLGLDTLLPSVGEVLSAAPRHGLELHLLTARSRPEWVPVQLRQLGILGLFAQVSIVAPGSASGSKAGLLRELQPLAFIGDTESDLAAAAAAEVPFAAVATGQRSAEYLQRAGASRIYPSLQLAAAALRVLPFA